MIAPISGPIIINHRKMLFSVKFSGQDRHFFTALPPSGSKTAVFTG